MTLRPTRTVLRLQFLVCIGIILVGTAVVDHAYWRASGPTRPQPLYAFPELGCPSFDPAESKLSDRPSPELSRGYTERELLPCYSPQLAPLYRLGELGGAGVGLGSAGLIWVLGRWIWRERRAAGPPDLVSVWLFGGTLVVTAILLGQRAVPMFFGGLCWGGCVGPGDVFHAFSLLGVLGALMLLVTGVMTLLVGTVGAVAWRLRHGSDRAARA